MLFIDKAEFKDKLRGKPIIIPYKGFTDKIKGAVFTPKRLR